MAKDPICGMEVDPNTSAYSYEHNGQVHFFCCHRCLEKFRAEPEKYLFPSVPDTAESGPTHAAVTAQPGNGNVYTCPMDPEVRQSEPGACPKCGMALESTSNHRKRSKLFWPSMT